MAPFRPTGPTVTVDNTARQVMNSALTAHMQYRVRNLNSAQAYFTWSTPDIASGGTPSISVTAPVAGTPAPNTIGMIPGSVEVFTFPANAWFIAASGLPFEITPGEGE